MYCSVACPPRPRVSVESSCWLVLPAGGGGDSACFCRSPLFPPPFGFRVPYLFFRYFAHELRLSLSSCCCCCCCCPDAEASLSRFSMWDDFDRASSEPNLEVNGAYSSASSSSSSSSWSIWSPPAPPREPTSAELLLRASLDWRSLSAAYRDRPLGYWSSPEIFLVAELSPAPPDDEAAAAGGGDVTLFVGASLLAVLS